MGKQITKTLCEECSGGREIITSSVTLYHLTSVKSLTSALLRKGHTLLTKEEAVKNNHSQAGVLRAHCSPSLVLAPPPPTIDHP